MTKSMTAFARAEHGSATWEIRSVNHRYLDTSFRMPDSFRHLEADLKNVFKGLVHRGKLECHLKMNSTESQTRIEVNESLVTALSAALIKIEALTGIQASGDALSIMRWPDVLINVENTDDQGVEVMACFEQAVAALVNMREREGNELAAVLEAKLQDVEATIVALRLSSPAIAATLHEKLVQRIEKIDLEVDPTRLEQELVILAQKIDVIEELDRLSTHVLEVRRNLSDPEPVGRRLDFLMQELNREANTLSSKAAVSTTTMHAVDLKVVIEQMREQIQNIE